MTLVFQLWLLFVALASLGARCDPFIDELTRKLLEEQYTTNSNFSYVAQAKIAGLFSSTIHNNFVGNTSALRRLELIHDNNFFVSGWVLQFLFEIKSLGIKTSFDAELASAALNVTSMLPLHFHDKNRQPSDFSFSFWTQSLENSSSNEYCAGPLNLLVPLTDISVVSKFLDEVCTDYNEVNPNKTLIEECIAFMSYEYSHFSQYLKAFGIPADSDDTSVALAISTYFLEYPEALHGSQKAYESWFDSDVTCLKNISSFFDNLSRYAYRPYSIDNDINMIDARTYYWIRNFIYYNEAQQSDDYRDLAFVSTWQMTNGDIKQSAIENSCYQAPLNINNVDATVASNAVFAITRALQWFGEDKDFQFSQDLEQIYLNTTNLLIWLFESDWINKRPELILLYYPPKYDFYWFVSRILREMRAFTSDKIELVKESYSWMLPLKDRLDSVMKHEATDQLLSHAISSNSSDGYYYWQEFLGLDDKTIHNEEDTHYDDRLFNTAMASNALINIWTQVNTTNANGTNISQIAWMADTPADVKTVLEGAILFLKENSLGDEYRPDNAFFSGSVKTFSTLPWVYPVNVWDYDNGSSFDPQEMVAANINDDLITGVRNVIYNDTYNKYMAEQPCGYDTPTTFDGYNYYGSNWAYWSSRAITHASTILAVAKYALL